MKYVGFGGSGYQVRDCLHPRDLISLLQMQFNETTESTKPRIINVSGGVENSMSLAQLTRWCNERFGEQTVEQTNTERQFDIPWMVLDNRKVTDIWNWVPQTPVRSVLTEIAGFAETKDNWCAVSAS